MWARHSRTRWLRASVVGRGRRSRSRNAVAAVVVLFVQGGGPLAMTLKELVKRPQPPGVHWCGMASATASPADAPWDHGSGSACTTVAMSVAATASVPHGARQASSSVDGSARRAVAGADSAVIAHRGRVGRPLPEIARPRGDCAPMYANLSRRTRNDTRDARTVMDTGSCTAESFRVMMRRAVTRICRTRRTMRSWGWPGRS